MDFGTARVSGSELIKHGGLGLTRGAFQVVVGLV